MSDATIQYTNGITNATKPVQYFVYVERGGELPSIKTHMTKSSFLMKKPDYDKKKWGYTVSHPITGEIIAKKEFDYVAIARESGVLIRDEKGAVVQSASIEEKKRLKKLNEKSLIRRFVGKLFN